MFCTAKTATVCRNFFTSLTDQLLGPDEKELGIVKFDTAETLIEEAVLEAETMPFFAARKIIMIRDQTLLAAGKDSKLDHQPDRLLEYLKEPCETSTIVFLVQADKLDERRKLVKRLKDLDVLLMFQELEGNDLLRWIMKRAQSQGRELSEDAAELITIAADIICSKSHRRWTSSVSMSGMEGKSVVLK